MNIADIVLVGFLFFGGVRGYKEGFLMEVISLVAIILGILGGFKLLGNAMLMLGRNFEINDGILPYLAFAVVFAIIVIVVSLLGRIIKSSIDKSFLGRIDQAMGALVSVIKVAFLISVVIWILESMNVDLIEKWSQNSKLYPAIAGLAPTITSWISNIIPAFREVF